MNFSDESNFELQVHKIIEENSWKNDIRVSECTIRAHVVVDIVISKMVFTKSSRERRTE